MFVLGFALNPPPLRCWCLTRTSVWMPWSVGVEIPKTIPIRNPTLNRILFMPSKGILNIAGVFRPSIFLPRSVSPRTADRSRLSLRAPGRSCPLRSSFRAWATGHGALSRTEGGSRSSNPSCPILLASMLGLHDWRVQLAQTWRCYQEARNRGKPCVPNDCCSLYRHDDIHTALKQPE